MYVCMYVCMLEKIKKKDVIKKLKTEKCIKHY